MQKFPADWSFTVDTIGPYNAERKAIRYVPGETRFGLAAFYLLFNEEAIKTLPLDEVASLYLMAYFPPEPTPTPRPEPTPTP